MMKLKEERIKAAEAYKAKMEAERKEKIENGEIEATNSIPQGASQKSASAADVIAAKNQERINSLTLRKSESMADQMDNEFESGSVSDKHYDKLTEAKIINKAKLKNGLQPTPKEYELEAEWTKVKHNDYIFHKEK